MIEWYQNLDSTHQLIFWFLLFVYCAVMSLAQLSFLKLPYLGWSRGFQSTPVFQVLMWLGALPLIVPALIIFFRRRRRVRSSKFIGNLRSKIFHTPSCEYQHKISSTLLKLPIDSLEDAEAMHFRPCNWCKPRG